MKKRAFTLVEILVVIGVIAVLSAILLPVFMRARERARQTASLNNLRQIGMATLLYATDYQDFLPHYRNNEYLLQEEDPEITTSSLPTDSKQPALLVGVINVYIRSKDVWFTDADSVRRRKNVIWGKVNHEFTSYEYWAYPDTADYEFPLVTSLSSMSPQDLLFAEDTPPSPFVPGYWSSNAVQSVYPDGRVVSGIRARSVPLH